MEDVSNTARQLALEFSKFAAEHASRQQSLDRHSNGLRTDYQAYIHASKYARWIEELGRRESWEETVKRYFDFMEGHLQRFNYTVPREQRAALERAVTMLHVMPSMRALMTAGRALEQSNIAGYNCSYLPIDHPDAFHETLYILMNGTGVGYSVERQYTQQLPPVPSKFVATSDVIHVADSRIGWSSALQALIQALFRGEVPTWDLRAVRPAGQPLKTFGGRASGPEPLARLFEYAVELFRGAAGRQLSSLECHDLVCKLAEIVVVGGVRRSALISLSNLEDDDMRNCKSGDWWVAHPHRAMANVSAVYDSRPSRDAFAREWAALRASGSGERGIFSRQAATTQAAANRGRVTAGVDFGTNPCSEIILRPFQFCNLTEVVVRAEDTAADLEEKVRMASTLGTWQATLTSWEEGPGGLRPIWRANTEEERLLGVSLTGIMDNRITAGREGNSALDATLQRLKAAAIAQNAEDAAKIGIPAAAAVTCVKPSGTVSQLVDAASGIHPRHSRFYIRRVRGGVDDPLTSFLEKEGVPCEPCVYNDKVKVFSFPIASPDGAVVRDDLSAIDQLKLCLAYQQHWCEHKPSVTVTVREHEWDAVGAWVYEHFDSLAGVSFLPYDMGTYQQTPYEAVEYEEYARLAAQIPAAINWGRFRELERHSRDDNVGLDLACSNGACEHVGEPLPQATVA